jgi:DNA-binding GntR family transcriptional regulator
MNSASQAARYAAAVRERSKLEDRSRTRSVARLHGLLRADIRHGYVTRAEQLVETELMKNYSASRATVRQALSQLAEEGLVTRVTGRGTTVNDAMIAIPLGDASGMPRASAHEHHNTLIDHGPVVSTPLLRDRLRTNASTVTMSEHVSFRQGHPYCVYTRYWVGESGNRPLTSDEPQVGFEQIFARAHGARLGRIDTTVQAITAPPEVARLLDVREGSVLLLKERLLTDEHGVPREFSMTHFVASQVALEATTIVPTGPHDDPSVVPLGTSDPDLVPRSRGPVVVDG